MDISRKLTAQSCGPIGYVSDDRAIEHVRVRVLPDGRMSRGDAARYLGAQAKTLAMWALQGKGPGFVKVGGRVFYYRTDLDAFIRGESERGVIRTNFSPRGGGARE
jgi:hypothetical protein